MSRFPIAVFALLLTACTATTTRPRADQPDLAAEYYASKRAGTDDIHRSYAVARLQMRRMTRVQSHSTEGEAFDRWRFLGPGNVGGRTRVLVIDPDQPDIMYAGGVSGGIWKTTNGGEYWEPIGDDLANIAVNSLAMHPFDRNVLYAGTGEGYFREEQRGTGLPLRGNGVYVTRDGGQTWSHLDSTSTEDFHWVNDLAISAHDPKRIYAATRTGVWRSNDEGQTWQRVLATSVKGGCLDLAYRGDTASDYLFASCGTFVQASVYRTTQGHLDLPWQVVLSEPDMGRTSLAIAPSNPEIVYALSASNQAGPFHQGLLAVFRSDQSGNAGSWQPRLTNTSSDPIATMLLTNVIAAYSSACSSTGQNQIVTMGWYCNTIAVDPADPDRVWAAGVDLFRSDDGGVSWGLASYWWADQGIDPSFAHADQHAIVFHPDYDGLSNRTAFFANDGGIYRTADAHAATARGNLAHCDPQRSALSFENLNNNFGVTQFYHGAVFPDGRRFIGGTQDNGTILGSIDDGVDGWKRVLGGDGAYVAIDPNDPQFVYAEHQNAGFNLSANGGLTFRPATIGLNDQFLFIAPFTLDPNDTTQIWLGGSQMWRATRGSTWRRTSTPMPGLVSAVAVAPGDSNRVIAGTNHGWIARTNVGTTAVSTTQWSIVKPRDGFVSSIAWDPANTSTVWATYAGFGGAHVWRSLDGGATWEQRDGMAAGALPDIPAHSIAIDPVTPNHLYLGTDLGVFVSHDSGLSWSVENTGFAAVVTEAVMIGPGQRGPAVYAFTHGRGAWRAELTLPRPKRRSTR